MISEPPPLGTAEDDEEWWEDEEFDDALGGLESLAELSEGLEPLPAIKALSERDIGRRLEMMVRKYPNSDAATDAAEAEYPGLFDLAWEATRSALDDRSFSYLEVLMARACHVLKPATGHAPPLKHERIIRGMAAEFAQVSALACDHRKPGRAMERWLEDTPQPIVMQDLAGVLASAIEAQRRKDRPSDEEVLVILAFLKAVVAELSRAMA